LSSLSIYEINNKLFERTSKTFIIPTSRYKSYVTKKGVAEINYFYFRDQTSKTWKKRISKKVNRYWLKQNLKGYEYTGAFMVENPFYD
jgi:hypothetical protein